MVILSRNAAFLLQLHAPWRKTDGELRVGNDHAWIACLLADDPSPVEANAKSGRSALYTD